VEKLLRSCPELDTIYLLLRPKKGHSVEERLDEFRNSPVGLILICHFVLGEKLILFNRRADFRSSERGASGGVDGLAVGGHRGRCQRQGPRHQCQRQGDAGGKCVHLFPLGRIRPIRRHPQSRHRPQLARHLRGAQAGRGYESTRGMILRSMHSRKAQFLGYVEKTFIVVL
jgi:Male sterility protein